MQQHNDDGTAIATILQQYHNIAVVGIPTDETRPAHYVSSYMQAHGYNIIPINPKYAGNTILGKKVYASLAEAKQAGEPIEIVDVFRRSADTPRVVREAVQAGAKAIWLQLGIINEDSRRIAEEANIPFVQNHCIKVEYARLKNS